MRSASFPDGTSPRFAVVLDLPVDETAARRMRDETGIELRDVTANVPAPPRAREGARLVRLSTAGQDAGGLQPPWVAMLDFVDWTSGRQGLATLSINIGIGEVYRRLAPTAQPQTA